MENDTKKKGLRDPKEFQVGTKDLQGSQIDYVYVTDQNYVIYRTKEGIKYYIFDDYLPEEQRIYWKRSVEIGPNLGRIYSLQPEELKSIETINRQIVRGLNQSLEGNNEIAKNILQDAENRLIRLRCLQGRLYYLISAGLVAMIPLAILLIFEFIKYFEGKPEFATFAKIATCGAFGGFLSVSLNVWKLEIDLDASRMLNFASGGSRIIISIVSAIFIYFAIKSKLVLGAMDDSSYGVLVASVVAGFSESFVPNIIRKVSEDQNSDAINKACKP